MKLAVISDIHGNLPALEAVINDIDNRGVDELVVLGDICVKGLYPNETVEILKKQQVKTWILGNTDKWIFEEEKKYDSHNSDYVGFCIERMKKENIEFLKNLPEKSTLDLYGYRILCVHGSPKSDTDIIGPDTTEQTLQKYLEGIKADIILSGHSHKPCIREFNNMVLANSGSIGFPFDENPEPSYLLIELDKRATFEVVRVGYDIDSYIFDCRSSGLPHIESFKNTLINGKLEV